MRRIMSSLHEESHMGLLLILIHFWITFANGVPSYDFKIIKEPTAYHGVENLFDNNLFSHTDFFMRTNQSFSLLINMQEEMMVNALSIHADYSENIEHTVHAGYINSEAHYAKSLPLPCNKSENGYICRLVCDTARNRTVIGENVLWTGKNIGPDGWVRIYEAKLTALPFELKNTTAEKNLILKRPFHVEDWTGEDCSQRYWELIDGSVPTALPAEGSQRAMTVFFGGAYFTHRVVLIPAAGRRNFEFEFGAHSAIISLDNDCSQDDRTYTCALQSLKNIPVDRITFAAGSLFNIQVYGSPGIHEHQRAVKRRGHLSKVAVHCLDTGHTVAWAKTRIVGVCPSEKGREFLEAMHFDDSCINRHIELAVNYPTMMLRTQKEADGFQLTCYIDSCMGDKDDVSDSSADQACQRPPGTLISCRGLELVRLPGNGDQHPEVLVREGEVIASWSEILPDLEIIESSPSSLVVKIPKKYQYYGQYKCSCTSADVLGTRVNSKETTFTPTDFDSDVVFQRRYWAAYEHHNSTFDRSSVIELPTEGRPGFFLMSATGFSFFETLRVNTSWTEERQSKSQLTQDAQLGSGHQFPDVKELENWTLNAYRLAPPIMYPDSADGQVVTYEWFLPRADSSLPPRRVIDKFWIIDVDKEPADKLRAWIVSKSVDQLELYVYFQHSNSAGVFNENSEANLELLEFGCEPDAAPQSLASFTLKTKEFIVQTSTADISPDIREYGRGAFINLNTYSTAFGYQLHARVKEQDEIFTKTLLSIPRAAEDQLKQELEDPQFEMNLRKVDVLEATKKMKVQLEVLLNSPFILDRLNCSTSTLQLVPDWLPDDAEATVFSTSPVYFDCMAPTEMASLDFRLVFTFDGAVREIPMSLPNPMREKLNPVFNSATSELAWQTVGPQLKSAVEEYKVKVISTSVACGTTEMRDISVRPRDNCTNERCQTTIWTSNQLANIEKVQSNYTLDVSPQFVGFSVPLSSGQGSTVSFTLGKTGPSILTAVYESETPREHIVSLEPYQSVSCGGEEEAKTSTAELDATFEIKSFGILPSGRTPIPIEGVTFTKVENANSQMPGGMYRVENLLPGREYELKGAIKYPSALEDEMSKEISFITPDEILVDVDAVAKELGEELQITCKAYVGTLKEIQKDVLWLRSDRSQLPEGASSRMDCTSTEDGYCTATLTIPKIEQRHDGDYGCFVEPPVEFFLHAPARSVIFTLRVGSLALDKKQSEAIRGESVEAICSTDHVGSLTWKYADGRQVPVYPSESTVPLDEPVFATPERPTGGRHQALRLRIKEATENTEGEYVCSMKKELDGAEATQRFKLLLNSSGSRASKGVTLVKTNAAPVKFGEEHVVTCRTESDPDTDHAIRWYWYRPEDAVFEAVDEESLDDYGNAVSTLRIRALPDRQGTLVCALIPLSWEFAEEPEVPYYAMSENIIVKSEMDLRYAAFVAVGKPYLLESGGGVAVDCFGYPSVANDVLRWMFVGLDETTAPFVIQSDAAKTLNGNPLLRCFSIGKNRTAKWLEQQTDESSPFKPDYLRVDVSLDATCLEAEGKLTCQYSGEHKLQSGIGGRQAVGAVPLEVLRRVDIKYSILPQGQPGVAKKSNGTESVDIKTSILPQEQPDAEKKSDATEGVDIKTSILPQGQPDAEEKSNGTEGKIAVSSTVSTSSAKPLEGTEETIRGSASKLDLKTTSDSGRVYAHVYVFLTALLWQHLV